jgi:hypothetical protein
MPDIWPELPIVISGSRGMSERQDTNNIIAALTQHDLVAKIDMDEIPNSFLTRMRAMEMRGPFSALKFLRLISTRIDAPTLPDLFLGGSAPRLLTLSLRRVPFPALPNLLLSTHDLVALRLCDIPLSGYISPDAMITCLSALARLKNLRLEFRSPRSRADRENIIPRPTRVVLPALTSFDFKGDSEYLEDIVGQIDTPLLTCFNITFFNQLLFDTPSLREFIRRTETFKAPYQARVAFQQYEVNVGLYLRIGNSLHGRLSLAISCRPSDWQLSSLAQVCYSALSPLLTLESLKIYNIQRWEDDVEDAQWLEFLHPFTSIKDLLIEEMSFSHGVLKQLAREIEAFSALQNLYLEGPQPPEPAMKMIGKFVAARQLSGRPVAVYHREWLRRTWRQMHWEVGN